jgi:hypothetical protein
MGILVQKAPQPLGVLDQCKQYSSLSTVSTQRCTDSRHIQLASSLRRRRILGQRLVELRADRTMAHGR